jgi:hypothetical protein
MSANAWWTLWTLTVTATLLITCSYVVLCVGKRCTLLKCCLSWHVWTVHSSHVRYSSVLIHFFMSVTCSFFAEIQPSVCLPQSLSVTTNFFVTYNRCDSCPIWRFGLNMISRERFLLENSSFYIFVLYWDFLPVRVVITRHFPHTLYVSGREVRKHGKIEKIRIKIIL